MNNSAFRKASVNLLLVGRVCHDFTPFRSSSLFSVIAISVTFVFRRDGNKFSGLCPSNTFLLRFQADFYAKTSLLMHETGFYCRTACQLLSKLSRTNAHWINFCCSSNSVRRCDTLLEFGDMDDSCFPPLISRIIW